MSKPLNIAIDIRYLRIATTGTRTYLEELNKEFKKLENDEIIFHFLDSSLPVYKGSNKILKWVEHFRHQGWKQITLPIKAFFNNADIVFCADDCVPLLHLGYKTILVIHDAFCFEAPQNYGKLWLWMYLHTAVPAAKRSAFIVTPTEYSKKKINFYMAISPHKLLVIPEGPKTLSTETDSNVEEFLQSINVSRHGYILHVGSMFKRKNIPALIAAFSKIKTKGYPELKLVLAGTIGTNNPEGDHDAIINAINNTTFKNDIILTGHLPNTLLALLYSNALLYVFPSVNEGFGIPVLEAFSYGLPVLVANNTCLPEVGGNAVLQFDPFDITDMTSKITLLLDDEGLRKEMIVKGFERLKNFSWRNTATQLIEVFKKAV